MRIDVEARLSFQVFASGMAGMSATCLVRNGSRPDHWIWSLQAVIERPKQGDTVATPA
jgi:hypothetical protein